MNLKMFYAVLGLIAVGGAGALWMASNRSGDVGTALLDAPVPVSTAAFPGYALGSDAAPVTVIEYADFLCNWCARFSVLTLPDAKARLVAAGRVKWVFRDFVLHDESLVGHHAAACAGEQDRFWDMHDSLMVNQRDWGTARRMDRKVREYAEGIGLDLDQYDGCMSEGRYVARLRATRDEGQRLGVSSTPTFIIGRMMVAGAIPYDSLTTLIDLAAGAQE
jgi:protein-disulfide isomerase